MWPFDVAINVVDTVQRYHHCGVQLVSARRADSSIVGGQDQALVLTRGRVNEVRYGLVFWLAPCRTQRPRCNHALSVAAKVGLFVLEEEKRQYWCRCHRRVVAVKVYSRFYSKSGLRRFVKGKGASPTRSWYRTSFTSFEDDSISASDLLTMPKYTLTVTYKRADQVGDVI